MGSMSITPTMTVTLGVHWVLMKASGKCRAVVSTRALEPIRFGPRAPSWFLFIAKPRFFICKMGLISILPLQGHCEDWWTHVKFLVHGKCSANSSHEKHTQTVHLLGKLVSPRQLKMYTLESSFLSWGHRKLAPPNTCQGEEETWKEAWAVGNSGWGKGRDNAQKSQVPLSLSQRNAARAQRVTGDRTSLTSKHSRGCAIEVIGGVHGMATPKLPTGLSLHLRFWEAHSLHTCLCFISYFSS